MGALEFGIYTDAATSTRISTALVFENRDLGSVITIDEHMFGTAPADRSDTFDRATYIYGLEMMGIAGIILVLGGKLSDRTDTIYIDNSNFRAALVRGYTRTPIISALVRTFGVARNGWLYGYCPKSPHSPIIPQAHRRGAPSPFALRRTISFGIIESLRRWVYSGRLLKRSS